MHCWLGLGLTAGLLGAPLASAASPFVQNVYVLTVKGGGLGVIEHEVIVFSKIVQAQVQPPLWIAERRRNNRKFSDTTSDHQWIDGRTCPALRPSLDSISSLPAMKFGAPGEDQPTGFRCPANDALRAPCGAKWASNWSFSRGVYRPARRLGLADSGTTRRLLAQRSGAGPRRRH